MVVNIASDIVVAIEVKVALAAAPAEAVAINAHVVYLQLGQNNLSSFNSGRCIQERYP